MNQRRCINHFVFVIVALGAMSLEGAQAAHHERQKAVLVTGASSGIGLNITEKLAAEMAPPGVTISVVEPGSFKSEIWRKMADHRLEQVMQNGEEVSEEAKQGAEGLASYDAGQPEPDAVATAVEHALFAESPKRRYMVTPNQSQADDTIRDALRRVAELSHDHEYSHTRDDLVRMLDEALEAL